MILCALTLAVFLPAVCGFGPLVPRDVTHDEALALARAVLARYPLVDGHNDLPMVYRRRLQNQVNRVNLTYDVTGQWGASHTDIPRLREGQVGAQFWSVFIGCDKNEKDGVRAQLEQIDVIRRVIDQYPETFELVTTAQGIEDSFARGKIGSLIGIEGAHGIDSSMAALRMMYELGVRYMTLTHTCTQPWVDASPEDDKPEQTHGGLTDWGKLVIQEMNRMGMLVDLSHVSKATMEQAIDMSIAPVIFSHSNVWELCQRSRNVQDDVIRAMAAKGGILMITFVPSFLDCAPSQGPANISTAADHIDYVYNLVGADHVGIGGDYDGVGRLPIGLEDVSKYPDLFAELIRRGWDEADLEKLAGRNLVRVFRETERVRDEMRDSGVQPFDVPIPQGDLTPNNQCRTSN